MSGAIRSATELLLVQKGRKICLEFPTSEKLITHKTADTRGGFPRLTLDSMHESETRLQCNRAKARDGLGDLEPTLFNLLDWYYTVDKSDPQGFGCIEDLPCDRKRECMSLAHGRRDRVEEHERPEAQADSCKAESRIFGSYHHVAISHDSRAASQRGTSHSANQRFRESGSDCEQCFLYSRWHEQIGDPTLADGILDRLVHNAHRIEMRGDSMRKNRGKATP